MKINELRIGNLVNSKLLNTNHAIRGVVIGETADGKKKETIYTDLQYSYSDIEDWQPIKLTEDLLVRFGNADKINKRNVKSYFTFDRFIFIWNPDFKYWYVITNSLDYLTKLEYVHEYQNFIFALTGIEIKLNK
jgi:hypothetical protein